MNIVIVENHISNLCKLMKGSAFEFEGKHYILTDEKKDGLLFCVDLKSGHVVYLDPRLEVKLNDVDVVIS